MLMLPLTLHRALSPYGHAEDIDVHNLKTALNHLGYYTPDSFTGIEEMREPALFEALQAFQADHGLAPSPHLTPHDPTVRAVNKALREQNMQGRYIWRSVGDSKVRDAHAAREGQIFTWGFPPQGGHPGEDFNCRCWAEVFDKKIPIPKHKPQKPICILIENRIGDLEKELVTLKDVHTNNREKIALLEVQIEEAQKNLDFILTTILLTKSPDIRDIMTDNQGLTIIGFLAINLEVENTPQVIEAREKLDNFKSEHSQLMQEQADIERKIISLENELLTLELQKAENCS